MLIKTFAACRTSHFVSTAREQRKFILHVRAYFKALKLEHTVVTVRTIATATVESYVVSKMHVSVRI